MIRDAQGNLYGTGYNGGAGGKGGLFQFSPQTQTLTTLYSFSGADGLNPNEGLALDAKGNLYGTTHLGGGAGNGGTVFEYSPGTQAFVTLHSFDGYDGAFPSGVLTFDSRGDVFGTTANTIFELLPTPEPGALAVLALGLGGVCGLALRARFRPAA